MQSQATVDVQQGSIGSITAKRQTHPAETKLAHWVSYPIALFLGDAMSIAAAIAGGWLLAFFLLGIQQKLAFHVYALMILVFTVASSLFAMGGYKPIYMRRQEREIELVFKGVTCGFFVFIIFNYIVFKTAEFSRYIFLFSYFNTMIMLIGTRFLFRYTQTKMWKNNIGRERAIIIGQNRQAGEMLNTQLRIQKFLRFEIIGYLRKESGYFLFGRNNPKTIVRDEISDFLKKLGVTTVFVDYGGDDPGLHQLYLNLLLGPGGKQRRVFALSAELMNACYSYERDDYIGLVGLCRSQSRLSRRFPRIVKRALDAVMAVFLVIFLSPVLIGIAVIIKLQDHGPILHRRRVVGLKGAEFDAFKFRTMVVDADVYLDQHPELKSQFLENFKLCDDPRITRFGKILRNLSLDELPQLLNVLLGQMSLIGPRMVTPEELRRYGDFKDERNQVRPGISGYWQVSGRQEVDYQERIMMDRFYMYRWSIWLDIWLILKTFQKVLLREGAY